ncbi:hypothetical protein HDU96_010984 [Phlyctochytrium bullatum]|nr:hypothetical protein HDU96_010984 [Phlyctochytrium bullatum]
MANARSENPILVVLDETPRAAQTLRFTIENLMHKIGETIHVVSVVPSISMVNDNVIRLKSFLRLVTEPYATASVRIELTVISSDIPALAIAETAVKLQPRLLVLGHPTPAAPNLIIPTAASAGVWSNLYDVMALPRRMFVANNSVQPHGELGHGGGVACIVDAKLCGDVMANVPPTIPVVVARNPFKLVTGGDDKKRSDAGYGSRTARDDPVSREMVQHVLDGISVDLTGRCAPRFKGISDLSVHTVLNEKRWITPETLDMILDICHSHGLQLDSNSIVNRSTGSGGARSPNHLAPANNGPTNYRSFSNPPTAPSAAPPPLPSRGPSATSLSPTTSRRPSANGPPPTAPKPSGFNPSSQLNSALSRAATNPAAQKAAGSYISSAASNPATQRAAGGAAASYLNSAAGREAAGPAAPFLAKAAGNEKVQKAAFGAAVGAAQNPAVRNGVARAVTSAAAGGGGKQRVVAIADYNSGEEGDLVFRMGDLITVLEDVDENWYRGELRGREGIFPKNHVEEK